MAGYRYGWREVADAPGLVRAGEAAAQGSQRKRKLTRLVSVG